MDIFKNQEENKSNETCMDSELSEIYIERMKKKIAKKKKKKNQQK